MQEEKREDFMLLSTYGDRGRYKFNEDSRGTELDELSTIHKPKAKVMSCSNTTFYFFPCVHSTCQRQPQYCRPVWFLSFVSAVDRLCRKWWLFLSHNLHRSSSSKKPSGTPSKNTTLANKRKAEADKIKSHRSLFQVAVWGRKLFL